MGKPLITLDLILISSMAAFAFACGPEVDDEDRPPGELEYEDSLTKLYRLERRVEVLSKTEDGELRECGSLTDRAYDELENTLAALDPGVDYGEHPADCNTSNALVHVDGFEHSPFECSFECCHRELYGTVFVYTMIFTNFDGGHPTIEGEPYVAIEPDQSCQ